MTAKEKLFAHLDADLFGFISQMMEFKVSVGGDPKTLALDQGKWYVVQTNDGWPEAPYHFTINGIWFQEYTHRLDQLFYRFEETLEKVKFWIDKDPTLTIDLHQYKALLEKARREIDTIDLSKYSLQSKEEMRDTVWEDLEKGHEIIVHFPPEAKGVAELKKQHLTIMDNAICLLVPSSSSIKTIQGVTILEDFRGEEDIKVRTLFRAFVNKFELDPAQEDLFVAAFTGKVLEHPVFWPKKERANLYRFLEGLVFESMLEEAKLGDKIPWNLLIPIFSSENGQPIPQSIRSYNKRYRDDERMMALIADLKR